MQSDLFSQPKIIPARVFSYDANGNVTNEKRFDGSTLNYTYNNDNRMVKAGTTDYKYNALGQRVYKK